MTLPTGPVTDAEMGGSALRQWSVAGNMVSITLTREPDPVRLQAAINAFVAALAPVVPEDARVIVAETHRGGARPWTVISTRPGEKGKGLRHTMWGTFRTREEAEAGAAKARARISAGDYPWASLPPERRKPPPAEASGG